MLTKVFQKVYNVHTSLDFIRKSHIIAFYDQSKKLSNNEKKQFAELENQIKSAHSIISNEAKSFSEMMGK